MTDPTEWGAEPVEDPRSWGAEPIEAPQPQYHSVFAGIPGLFDPEPIPQAYLDRLAKGAALTRIVGRAMSSAGEGFGEEPFGLSDEHRRQLQDLRILPDPARGWPGPLMALQAGAIDVTANGIDTIMRGVAAGIHGAGGAFGQLVEEFTGSETQGIKAEREAINFGNFRMVDNGQGNFARHDISRDNIIRSQPIGGLPTAADFENAANVIAPARLTTPVRAEEDLRRLWWERGVLPSEAVQRTEFAALAKEPVGFIVWHGSGANFDAFDFSKIGTGEGAQVYGHGGYFGEARSTGEFYQNTVGGARLVNREGKEVPLDREQRGAAKRVVEEFGGDIDKAIEDLRTKAEKSDFFKDDLATLERWKDEGIQPQPGGVLYRVRINADPEDFLEWDKPLNEQSPSVTEALSRLKAIIEREAAGRPTPQSVFMLEDKTIDPKTFHKQFADYDFDPHHAAEMMREAGLPGIKYLDQDSRNPKIEFVSLTPEESEELDRIGWGRAPNVTFEKEQKSPAAAWEKNFRYWRSLAVDGTEKARVLDKLIANKDFTPVPPKPTRNYVVFDDQAVQITHKNDVPMESLRELWQERGIHPAEAAHDAGQDAFLRDEIAQPAGAAVTPPGALPTPQQQPLPPPGSLVGAARDAATQLLNVWHSAQMSVSPMVRGSQQAMALAKDFANAMRRNRWEWNRIDRWVVDNPDLKAARERTGETAAEQRKRMWDAADEESVLQQEIGINPGSNLAAMRGHMGLATLEPEERAVAADLHARAQAAWQQAIGLDMVNGNGLPFYTPRMMLGLANGVDPHGLPLDAVGRNLRTRTGQMLHREHLTAEDTEEAAKRLVENRMREAGKTQAEIDEAVAEVKIARDIRSLPLATAKLEDAIAGRMLINGIEDAGKATGAQTVSYGSNPGEGWFTLDHPSLYRWQPRFKDGAVVKDADDNIIFDRVPIYVRGDFEGPLRAVLSQETPAWYGAIMSVKARVNSMIMLSPAIHFLVEYGRALPAMPGKVAFGRVYFKGYRAKIDPATMREAIGDGGLVPIGRRFFNQDITSIMEEPNLAPGPTLGGRIAGAIPGIFDADAGAATEAAVSERIEQFKDVWHNTLLWDRIGDLQAGLYVDYRDGLLQKGMDRLTAVRMAAHWANRYAGSLPQEIMSANARMVANVLMFSRSFTMGNWGAMKDMFTGLPRDVMAQIERDSGGLHPEAAKMARSMAIRKAVSIITIDVALMYAMNSILQSSMNVIRGDHTVGDEFQGYAQRTHDALQDVKDDPMGMLYPLPVVSAAMKFANHVSSTYENEPSKRDRVRIGTASDGSAIYMRNPVGKIGEEFTGYLNSPFDMILRKQSTIIRPLWEILSNDRGFGRKVYNKDAELSGDQFHNAIEIAKVIAKSQVPEGQIEGAYDLLKGNGDTGTNIARTFGPIAGLTFSEGAEGGPAVGGLYHMQDDQRYRVQRDMPDIRLMIKRGDMEGAREAMTRLGMSPAWQRSTILTTQNPALRLNPRAMRDLNRPGYATPDMKRWMDQQMEMRR